MFEKQGENGITAYNCGHFKKSQENCIHVKCDLKSLYFRSCGFFKVRWVGWGI